MLYVGIDLHGKQITVCVRDEAGNVVLRRQVSTRPEKVAEFLEELRRLWREVRGRAGSLRFSQLVGGTRFTRPTLRILRT